MEKGDILGHEPMGEVVALGSAITKFQKGDRVVVPFTICCGECFFCKKELWSCCDRTNRDKEKAEKLMGHAPAGLFGYSHLTGHYPGGQAEYLRVPYADVSPFKVENDSLTDEQVLFLSDIFPTGYMAAENAEIEPGDTVAVWGCGPVGQFAIASAKLLGAERIVAIDRVPERLAMALEKAGATDAIDYEHQDVRESLLDITGGVGPDACIDAVGTEAHMPGPLYAYDRIKQAAMPGTDRAFALRQAIRNCRNGGTVSVIGVYGGFVDKFPMGSVMNRSLTIRTGQCHVHRYLKPLLARIEKGEIDPSFVISHHMRLDEAPSGYDKFMHKADACTKIVLKAA
jgi:threonine dehydrogenase-like Zn-dependent dehydrogenase